MARPKKEQKEEVNEIAVLTHENAVADNSSENNTNITSEEDKSNEIIKIEGTITPSEKPNDTSTESEPQIKLEKHIEDILKIYPQYESLYIDSEGGVFTTDTNQNIRGKAILYKNPYHN